jgi:hypothetical protein
MTLLAQKIQREIIDWFNNTESDYHDEEDGPVEYLSSAIDGFADAVEYNKGGVQLASGTAKFIKQKGGEGEGEKYYIIFSVGDATFKVDGYYSSWEGANWDSAEVIEVEPVEVLVTKYKVKAEG